LLTVTNISKSFTREGREDLLVLNAIGFQLHAGKCMALMGANGSGKTTLLNILAGLIRCDDGHIMLDDLDICRLDSHKIAKAVGYVNQNSYKSISSELRVGEVIALAANRNSNLSFRKPQSSTALDYISSTNVHIAEFLSDNDDIKSEILSGGQRQLLAIVSAILGNPKMLLLDEHLSSLDQNFKNSVNDLITTYIHQNEAIAIMVMHDENIVSNLCSHKGVLKDSQLSVVEMV